jgi:hypothetical protein
VDVDRFGGEEWMIDSSVVEIRHPLYTEKEGRGMNCNSFQFQYVGRFTWFAYFWLYCTNAGCIDTMYAHDANRCMLRDFPEWRK